MELKVFDEGNVLQKVINHFWDYGMKRIARGDHYMLQIMVEEPWHYRNLIDAFGQSVIVEKPEEFRQAIIQDSLQLYDRYLQFK